VLALCAQYPRWGKAKLAVLLARQGIALAVSMVGRILRYLRQCRLLVEPQPTRATPAHAMPARAVQTEGRADPQRAAGRSGGD